MNGRKTSGYSSPLDLWMVTSAQLALGLQAKYLLPVLAVGLAHRLPEPAQQGVLPVQLAARLLQQLAEMEEVGQPPLP